MLEPLIDWLVGTEGQSPTSTIISGVALIVALVATWITLRNKRHEDRRQIRSSVHALISRIFDLRAENEREKLTLLKTGDYQAYNTQTNANIEHLGAIAQLAKDLVEENHVRLSAGELAILANALAMSNDPVADAYWRKAVARASSAHDRTSLYQNYGSYLYATGNRVAGNAAFASAEALLKTAGNDPFSIGRHHHVHAMSQYQAGLASDAEASYDLAHQFYASVGNEQRQVFALQSLAQSRAAQTLPKTG